MPTLVLFALALRRAARAALPIACILSVAAAVVLDAVSPLELPYALAAAGVLVVLLARRVRRRARTLETSARREIELAMLLVVAAFGAVVRLDGSLDGPLYPAILVGIALVAAFARPVATFAAVVLAAGIATAAALLFVVRSLRRIRSAPAQHISVLKVCGRHSVRSSQMPASGWPATRSPRSVRSAPYSS